MLRSRDREGAHRTLPWVKTTLRALHGRQNKSYSMTCLSLAEAMALFSELLQKATLREEVIVFKESKPAAR
jgi:hypothetical protein